MRCEPQVWIAPALRKALRKALRMLFTIYDVATKQSTSCCWGNESGCKQAAIIISVRYTACFVAAVQLLRAVQQVTGNNSKRLRSVI